jgi:catalase
MTAAPILYDPSCETPEEDELKVQREIQEAMAQIRATTLADGGVPLRSVHAKSHGLFYGEIEVLANLPPQLAQGMFAVPKKYPLVMRLSTSPGDIMTDLVSTPRGLAIKIIGVEGPRVAGSEDAVTQDFVLANAPAFQAPNAGAFLKSLKLLAPTTDKMEPAKVILSTVARAAESVLEAVGTQSPALKGLGGHPLTHILGESFYAQAPILYGAYIAKIGVFPTDPELVGLKDAKLENTGEPDGLRNLVHDFFKTRSGSWELRVQLCTDLETMPVEDAAKIWPEEASPYVTVARITAPPQDTWSAEKQEAINAGLSFSPWHALAAHRPLGAVMRARKVAYEQSAKFRAEHNHVPFVEPKSLDEIK